MDRVPHRLACFVERVPHSRVGIVLRAVAAPIVEDCIDAPLVDVDIGIVLLKAARAMAVLG